MSDGSLPVAHRLLSQAVDVVSAAPASGSGDELITLLSVCEASTRRLDQITVDAVAALQRKGTFTERNYKTAGAALSDLLGWERFEARRRVVADESVTARVGLDGAARLPHTAAVFAAGQASLRHVAVIAGLTEWICRIRDGLPEFTPTMDRPQQRPRRKALPHLAAAS
jgi:5-methylcytosine-specific restriction protein A